MWKMGNITSADIVFVSTLQGLSLSYLLSLHISRLVFYQKDISKLLPYSKR